MLNDVQLAEAEQLFQEKIHPRRTDSQYFEDCWMFHSGENIDESKFSQVKKVQTQEDLLIFLDTMNRCFQKNDSQNPYGELGEYLVTAKESWIKNQDRLQYFIVYKGEQPVAVASLTTFHQLGYISNVGSLKEVRGQGFGKLATLFCVRQSVLADNLHHFLGTEAGNYPYEFYKRLGFIDRFRAVGWSK